MARSHLASDCPRQPSAGSRTCRHRLCGGDSRMRVHAARDQIGPCHATVHSLTDPDVRRAERGKSAHRHRGWRNARESTGSKLSCPQYPDSRRPHSCHQASRDCPLFRRMRPFQRCPTSPNQCQVPPAPSRSRSYKQFRRLRGRGRGGGGHTDPHQDHSLNPHDRQPGASPQTTMLPLIFLLLFLLPLAWATARSGGPASDATKEHGD